MAARAGAEISGQELEGLRRKGQSSRDQIGRLRYSAFGEVGGQAPMSIGQRSRELFPSAAPHPHSLLDLIRGEKDHLIALCEPADQLRG